MSALTNLIDELRRRRVFRVAAFYGGIAFVIVQIIDGTFEVMGIPAWVSRLLIIILAVGFPISMIFAWVFDITEEGIVRTKGRTVDMPKKDQPFIGNSALVVIALVAIAFGIWGRWGGVSDNSISIAVLPFANMSDDAEQEYFSDGITEELLNALAHVPQLRVAGRTSSFAFKGKNEDLRTIGSTLGVSYLLEGSIRRAGDRVRITAQLIKVSDGFHLWSDTYERPLTDIFALQDEISTSIAQALTERLLPKETSAPRSAGYQPSTDAYDVYLRARYHLAKRSIVDIQTAVDYFVEATELDPNFPQAWSGLSKASLLLTTYSPQLRFDDALYEQALTAAHKAIALDPNLAEGHMALGIYFQSNTWDHETVLFHKLKAITLDPDDSEIINFLGDYYNWMWDFDEALKIEKRAAEADPLSIANILDLASVYFSIEDYPNTRKLVESARTLAPNNNGVHLLDATLAFYEEDAQRLSDLIEWFRVEGVTHRIPYFSAMLALLENDRDAFARHLSECQVQLDNKLLPASHIALLHLENGDLDNAAKLLRLRPQEGSRFFHIAAIRVSEALLKSPNTAHREALDRPEHKAYFDARLKR